MRALHVLWAAGGAYISVDRDSFKDGARLLAAVDAAMPAERVRVDKTRRAERETIRSQVVALVNARRRFILGLALLCWLAVTTAIAIPTTGAGLFILTVIAIRLTRRTLRMKLKPVSISAVTDTVQRILQPGEQSEHLAAGRLEGRGRGLIVLTDRRLVFAENGLVLISLDRDTITRARASLYKLRVEDSHRTVRFDRMPLRSRRRLAQALNHSTTPLPANLAHAPADA